MAAPRVPRKWRPTLTMIVMAVLLSVLILPVAIVVWLRALDHSGSPFGFTEGMALAVALAITVGVGLVFSRTIAGPINALVRRANAIGQGGRSAIVAPEQLGTRELAALSDSLLDLATRLVDRTEYVSGFAAHVSHELKSPVTAIRGAAELMRDTRMPTDCRRCLGGCASWRGPSLILQRDRRRWPRSSAARRSSRSQARPQFRLRWIVGRPVRCSRSCSPMRGRMVRRRLS